MYNERIEGTGFEDLVVGNFNRAAVMAAKAVSAGPVTTQRNPLVLVGGVGTGKTALLRAVAYNVACRGDGRNVKSLTVRQLIDLYIESIKSFGRIGMVAGIKSADILLVDGLEDLSKTVSVQDLFAEILDGFIAEGKQVICASRELPERIADGKLENGLLSRLSSGAVLELKSPSLADRQSIVRREFEKMQWTPPAKVVLKLAKRQDNIWKLKGAVHKFALRRQIRD